VAIVHNTVKETIRAHLTLVHVFHAYASVDTPWVAHALSRCTHVRYGRIAFVSGTHKATQFTGPQEILYVPAHNSNLFTGLDDQSLINSGRGYHLGVLNFRSEHSSSFPFYILHFPLIAPPGL
jgi:hypothetical protein